MESAAVPDSSHAFNDEVEVAPPGMEKIGLLSQEDHIGESEKKKEKVVDIKTPQELKEAEEAKKHPGVSPRTTEPPDLQTPSTIAPIAHVHNKLEVPEEKGRKSRNVGDLETAQSNASKLVDHGEQDNEAEDDASTPEKPTFSFAKAQETGEVVDPMSIKNTRKESFFSVVK